jgi:hypothetical protein
MGRLVSSDVEEAIEACFTAPGQAEMCASSNVNNSLKMLGVVIALLY